MRKKCVFLFIFAIGMATVSSPSRTTAATLFFTVNDSVPPTSLYSIDTETYVYTLLGSMENRLIPGLSPSPFPNVLYAVDRNLGEFLTIDVSTFPDAGSVQVIGSLDRDIQELAYDASTDTLYGFNFSTNRLTILDRNTGAFVSNVGSIGFRLRGITFNQATGTLYGLAAAQFGNSPDLYVIDPSTANATKVNDGFPGLDQISGIHALNTGTADDPMYAVGRAPSAASFFSIDQATAVATVLTGLSLPGEESARDLAAPLAFLPPDFSKEFSPSSVAAGAPSTLTFTIDNSANAASATSLDFTDNLPAGLAVAAVPNASTTCTGGTLTAEAATAVVSYTGGTVPAGGSCAVSVDVSGQQPGEYENTSGDLTSSFGNSGTAEDTLTVTAVAPVFGKAFSPASVAAGAPSTLTFNIDNSANAAAATSLDFTDSLPAGLAVAAVPNASTTCTGGTLTAAAATAVVGYIGGTVPAGGSCAVSVDVAGQQPGEYENTSGDLTSSFGNSGTAEDTLTVTAVAPVFGKAFSPASVAAGAPSTLTFNIDNSANAAAATSLDFTDSLPAGLAVAAAPNASTTCTGGTLTAAAATAVVGYIGGTVPAGGSCAVSVDVAGQQPGEYENTSGDLTSSFGNSGTAEDTLTVTAVAPVFGKAFSPASVAAGAPSTLTFNIDNSANAAAATSLDFTDSLPAGLAVAAAPNASTTCTGGTLTAAAATAVVSYTGGTVPAGGSCAVSVDVAGQQPGEYENTSGDLTSSFGNSGTAEDTLTVTAVAPVFGKAFSPASVAAGAPSTLTFNIDNSANAAAATSLDFTDNLPAGLVVAAAPNASTTCTGGTLTAEAATAVVGYTGGTVPAGGSCAVSVDVAGQQPGEYPNTSGDLTSSFGNSGSANATLVVVAPIPALSGTGTVILLVLLGLVTVLMKRRHRTSI